MEGQCLQEVASCELFQLETDPAKASLVLRIQRSNVISTAMMQQKSGWQENFKVGLASC